jgi:hypothetical protein
MSHRFPHTVEFTNENTRKPKPAGVIGAETTRAAHVSKRFLPGGAPPAWSA